MGFENVLEMMLSMLNDYDIIGYTEEDLYLEVGIRVNIVLAKAMIEDLLFDSEFLEFSRDLTLCEANILAHGLIMQWLYPKVHNTEVLEAQLTNKEFTAFSNANRINAMIQLQRNAQEEFYYLVNNYDFYNQKLAWQEESDN
jgi:hypothetical protein